jgi:hypothetical protein
MRMLDKIENIRFDHIIFRILVDYQQKNKMTHLQKNQPKMLNVNPRTKTFKYVY